MASTTLLETSGEHGNIVFTFRAMPSSATEEAVHAFTFSVIQFYHVSGRRLPYIMPVRDIPCFRLPLDIFVLDDASCLADGVAELLFNIECFRDPDTFEFLRNQVSGFCLQTIQSHGNLTGITFHIIADLHFHARQVDGGLGLISSPEDVDDFYMDEERSARSSEEATAAEMAIAKLDRLNVAAGGPRSSEFGQQGCSICFEDFDEAVGDLDLARLPCGHIFHFDCIVQWLERNQVCPLCRHQV